MGLVTISSLLSLVIPSVSYKPIKFMTNTQRIEEYVRNRMRELNEEMANLRLSVDSEADRYFDIKERLNELSRLWDSVIRL